MTIMSPGKYLGLRRLADDNGRFKMLAIDQRPPIEKLVREGRGSETPSFEDVAGVKELLLENLGPYATASLLDPQYIFPAALDRLPRGSGLLLTLEYDVFEEAPEGRLSSPIPDWSVRKIQTAGGDAVKVLAWYRPDAAASVKEHQQQFVAGIGAECTRLDIPFVFELLLYPLPSEDGHTTDYVEHPEKRSDHVIESVETFADPSFGVDLFKLESPLPIAAVSGPSAVAEGKLADVFSELDRAAGKPWVMLSAGADATSFKRVLEFAFDAGASGYLAGRAIWWDPCVAAFPDFDAMGRELKTQAVPYMEAINALTDARAVPWTRHRSFGGGGPRLPRAGDSFRSEYLGGMA